MAKKKFMKNFTIDQLISTINATRPIRIIFWLYFTDEKARAAHIHASSELYKRMML